MLLSISQAVYTVAFSFCFQAIVSSAVSHGGSHNALLPRADDTTADSSDFGEKYMFSTHLYILEIMQGYEAA